MQAQWNEKHFPPLRWGWSTAFVPVTLLALHGKKGPSHLTSLFLCSSGCLWSQKKKIRGLQTRSKHYYTLTSSKRVVEITQTTATAVPSEIWGFCPMPRSLKSLNYMDETWVSRGKQEGGQQMQFSGWRSVIFWRCAEAAPSTAQKCHRKKRKKNTKTISEKYSLSLDYNSQLKFSQCSSDTEEIIVGFCAINLYLALEYFCLHKSLLFIILKAKGDQGKVTLHFYFLHSLLITD